MQQGKKNLALMGLITLGIVYGATLRNDRPD